MILLWGMVGCLRCNIQCKTNVFFIILREKKNMMQLYHDCFPASCMPLVLLIDFICI
uniref:Uncharacterized protein n=1 Tax=Rhizophora mucronata TaxID=61149 RepID=A0A2P2NLT4_RHIMU